MLLKYVLVEVTHSLMNISQDLIPEHMVPIYQARFGHERVNPLEDDERCTILTKDVVVGRNEHNIPIVEKEPIDFTVEEIWSQLMANPTMVQTGEQSRTPAPLIAYPRGALDLADFYKRMEQIRGPLVYGKVADEPEEDNVVELETASTKSETEQVSLSDVLEKAPKPKTERELMMERLDSMGIEYKGNASNKSLRAMLDEVLIADGSTTIQNEG